METFLGTMKISVLQALEMGCLEGRTPSNVSDSLGMTWGRWRAGVMCLPGSYTDIGAFLLFFFLLPSSLPSFLLFFFSCTFSMWTFPGQGLNLCHSSDPLRICSDNARSLICCARKELPNVGVVLFCFVLFFGLLRAVPMAYGGSHARGQIGAVAAGLYHSHSNTRSKLCL